MGSLKAINGLISVASVVIGFTAMERRNMLPTAYLCFFIQI
jgi:hypothetical protein